MQPPNDAIKVWVETAKHIINQAQGEELNPTERTSIKKCLDAIGKLLEVNNNDNLQKR